MANLTTVQVAMLTGLNRDTVNPLLGLLRGRMAEECEAASPFGGEVEVDESYFGPRRVGGRRGRGVEVRTVTLFLWSTETATTRGRARAR